MSNTETPQIIALQEQILELLTRSPRPISEATAAAFRAVPRHAFVSQYQAGEKTIDVTPQNLAEHLPAIYNNGVLTLWKDNAKGIFSTISQPTLVLWMLDLLQLTEGQTVIELGAGSGWNAALIGNLVGPKGRVYSVEIIPEIAEAARRAIEGRGITNVEIITGDGGDGYTAGAPYDRAVFTAGSYDLPQAFHAQVREGGILLMVVKVEGGGDQLFVLEKKSDCFEAKYGALCAFVPVTGKHAFTAAAPSCLSVLPTWTELRGQEVERRGFWWGGNGEGPFWGTVGVRSFLSMVEPKFRVFYEEGKPPFDPQHWFCGVFDPEAQSLVIAQHGVLISYGNLIARDCLLGRLHQWIDLGMPSMAAMNLRVFPIDVEVRADSQQWVVRRKESTFVWSLKRPGEE